jgi:RND family efflux transporter MFP subunit
LIAVAGLSAFIFLRQPEEPEIVEPKKISVKVMEIESSINQDFLNFIGIIQPRDLNQASFTTIGTIEAIYVKEGQTVKKGAALAMLDSEQAEIQIENSEEALKQSKAQKAEADANLRAAQSDYDKEKAEEAQVLETKRIEAEDAREAANTAKADYDQAVIDYGEDSVEANLAYNTYLAREAEATEAESDYQLAKDAGVSSDVEIAQARLDAAKANVDSAEAQVTISQNNLDSAKENLESNILRSGIDGTVVKVVSNVGDVGSPLAPSVIVASHEMVVHIGISQGAVNDIKSKQKAEITVNEETLIGSVLDVAKLPDSNSRTYLARIQFNNAQKLNIGETASVAIDVGKREGIWLNLSTILNDGEDFVYIIQNDRVVKRRIEILSINNNLVLVTGLNVNDYLVVEGGRFLSVGSEVNITEILPYE